MPFHEHHCEEITGMGLPTVTRAMECDNSTALDGAVMLESNVAAFREQNLTQVHTDLL